VVRTNPDKRGEVTEWTNWVVSSKAGAPDLREFIAAAAMQNGTVLRELRTEVITLERVFLRLIEEAETPAKPAPAEPLKDTLTPSVAPPTGTVTPGPAAAKPAEPIAGGAR